MKKLFFMFLPVLLVSACAPKTQQRAQSHSESLDAYLPDLRKEAEQVEKRHRPVLVPVEEAKEPSGAIAEELERQYGIFTEKNVGKASTFYSIQVYSGSSRTRANEARARLIRFFPEMRPVLQWQSPIYRVRVGRFYDRLDAYKTLSSVRKAFPLAKSFPEKVVLSEELDEGEHSEND